MSDLEVPAEAGLEAGPARRTRRWPDVLVACVLLVGVTLALWRAGRTQGFTRDEGYYFQAAEQQIAYYEEAFAGLRKGRFLFADRGLIDRGFSYNSEHPPLMKTLFGLSWRLLHRCRCPEEAGLHPLSYPRRHATLGLLSQGEAMRLPANLLAGLLCAAVYLLAARGIGPGWGRRAGVCAAALTILAPRHFFHAELSCFDAPIAAMIFLVTAAYYQAQRSGRRGWLILCGVLAGLALSTKHNAFFLPFVLLLHSLWVRRAHLREALKGRRLGPAVRWVVAPWVLYMAALAIPIYWLSWPWLYHDGLRRFGAYVGFHLNHVYYNIEYLGQNYNKPPFPWHYVFVTTLLTAPLTTLVLALLGALLHRPARPPRTPADDPSASAPLLLVAIGILWPMLLIARPGTPIFGAEKHWLPAIPFLGLLAGLGAVRVWDRFAAAFAVPGAAAVPLGWAVVGMALGPPALEVWRSHPYGLSHYNVLAGGPAGAAELGMNRGFWGYAVRGLFPYLNQRAPAGASLYWHDANWYQLQMSMKDGFLRRDLRDSGMEEPGVRASDWALVIHERHFNKYEYWIWDAYGTTRPARVLTHEGVPLVTLYSRQDER